MIFGRKKPRQKLEILEPVKKTDAATIITKIAQDCCHQRSHLPSKIVCEPPRKSLQASGMGTKSCLPMKQRHGNGDANINHKQPACRRAETCLSQAGTGWRPRPTNQSYWPALCHGVAQLRGTTSEAKCMAPRQKRPWLLKPKATKH